MDGVDPALNMAYDEACVGLKSKLNLPTTLRLYRWNPSAVTIGYFQSLEQEVDTNECLWRGIKFIRRWTGGGAVYHHYEGEVTYSLIISQDSPLTSSDDIVESYKKICSGIIEGLKGIGIESNFRPINDIVVENRKISGNAQTRRMGQILQHGTILYDVNPKLMFTLLKVPDEKLKDKIIKKVEDSVTSIKRELGNAIEPAKVIDSMAQGFSKALDLDLIPSRFTPEEEDLARKLAEEKYDNPIWNRRR